MRHPWRLHVLGFLLVGALCVVGYVAWRPATTSPKPSPAPGAPRERDTWHIFTTPDGTRYGWVHTQVVRLPDGNYRMTRESRQQWDVSPHGKDDIEERATYVVTPAYRPLSIDVEGTQAAGVTRATGRPRGERFEVKMEIAGVARCVTFHRADQILPLPFLDDWLADRPGAFERGEVTLLDGDSCEIRPTWVRRLGTTDPGSAWSVDLGPEGGELRVVLDADGLLRQSSSEAGFVVLRRGSAEEARDLSHRKTDDRYALYFPADGLGDPNRLTSLTVELRWTGIDIGQFRLTGDGQSVVEHGGEGGHSRAVVRLDVPQPVAETVRLPVGGAEFAPYLGESRYIKPRDPRIVAVAREVVGDRTDALEAVRALSVWVCGNVTPAGVATVLTGPEVLACRKGVCKEYATLFASLARAVGIPTRVALGVRLCSGFWGGHMWNEVYVGRWITVDAGYNEVGTSTVNLKLIDHESVEGTGPLHTAVRPSLEVKVLEHRAKPTPRAGRFWTGITGVTYTNAELGCRLTAPGPDWSLKDKTDKDQADAMISFEASGKGDVHLHFVAFSLPGQIETKTLLRARLTHYKSIRKAFEVLTEDTYPVKGLPGNRLSVRYTSAKGQVRRGLDVIWRTESSCYLLTLDATEADFGAAEPGFSALLKSFENLDRK
jgi:hypothetical protein